MNEEQVVADNENTAEEVVLETTEETTEPTETVEESVDEIKSRLAKAEELNKSYKIRAEKAEKLAKSKETIATQSSSLSLSDFQAIKDVHADDVERLERFAKAEGVSLKEAVKNPEWKAIQDLRAEQRQVASATNTTTTRRSSGKTSDDALLSNVSSGKMPESDEDIARLMKLKSGKK